MMFGKFKKNVKRTELAHTPFYKVNKKVHQTEISVIQFNNDNVHFVTGFDSSVLPVLPASGITWINVAGLANLTFIQELAKHYELHALTLEDIINSTQRPKLEEFPNYQFITIKALSFQTKNNLLIPNQCNFVFNKNFVISFQEKPSALFQGLIDRIKDGTFKKLKSQSTDYLVYRLLDTIVDEYFVVLEGLGELVEKNEEKIISNPQSKTIKILYRLKRQLLQVRRVIWPLREVVSHLLQDDKLISSFTRLYMRDLYDHVVQSIDSVEMLRDMLASMFDIYLSSLTNRMNEIMKTLTIISTIFIPITFVASLYGMNFVNMPELHWRFGYITTLGVMGIIIILMLVYFRLRKWI